MGSEMCIRDRHIERGRAAAFSDGSYYSDGTTHSDMSETVIVTTPDGIKHDILHTCGTVLVSLESETEFFHV